MSSNKKRKTYESEQDSGATYIAVPKQVKSYVNRAIRKATELKYIDFDINGSASTTGTYQVRLNTIGVGTGYNQRIGDSVKLRRIEWDLDVQAGDNFNITRTIIGACRNSTYPPLPLATIYGGTNPDFGPYILDKKTLSSSPQLMETVELKLLRSNLSKEVKNQTPPSIQLGVSDLVELEYLSPVSQ